jgi:XTP/dITP diphosphohydrolase
MFEDPPTARARALAEVAAPGLTAVWLGSPDGDPGLTDALAELLSRRAIDGTPPEVELVTASHDVPGSRLLDLVAVMDRLRSPGGCPWDAEQTHASLAPYLLEEAHEVLEAIDSGSREHLREELGDLLLQVALLARVALEHETEPFDVDDVAAGIVAKLVRRHPHVFGRGAGDEAVTAADVEADWQRRKSAEKRRRSALDGVPLGLPALTLADKLMARAARGGSPVTVAPAAVAPAAGAADSAAYGGLLLSLVASARAHGIDAEAALRAAARRYADAVRAEEDAARAGGAPR